MTQTHQIFLIPGFFGFADIGDVLYFAHVVSELRRACAEVGVKAAVHAVPTHPTASVRRRAHRLLRVVSERAEGSGPIHLVGHSSGGLDARLMVAPGASLGSDEEREAICERVRTVVTVASPNHGTPVASFFTSVFGQQLLRLLSVGTIYVLRFGRLPTSVLLKLGAIAARMDAWVGLRHNVVDQLYEQLLADFSPERRRAVESYFNDLGSDQALMPQLTPEGVDMFNVATAERAGVRYGSVISYARKPGVVTTARVGLDPYGQATHALFSAVYRLASGMPAQAVPELSDTQLSVLFNIYGIVPERHANDGVVPTVSQIWGDIVHATRADHLDLLGHYGDPSADPPHYDWLSSGSGFTPADFHRLWTDVSRYIAGLPVPVEAAPPSRGRHQTHLFSR